MLGGGAPEKQGERVGSHKEHGDATGNSRCPGTASTRPCGPSPGPSTGVCTEHVILANAGGTEGESGQGPRGREEGSPVGRRRDSRG